MQIATTIIEPEFNSFSYQMMCLNSGKTKNKMSNVLNSDQH
jgi:hypothetical protein